MAFIRSFIFPGKTYFFKGKGYWQFDDYHMRVAHNHTLASAQRWMHCPERGGGNGIDSETANDDDEDDDYYTHDTDENGNDTNEANGMQPTQRSSLVSASSSARAVTDVVRGLWILVLMLVSTTMAVQRCR